MEAVFPEALCYCFGSKSQTTQKEEKKMAEEYWFILRRLKNSMTGQTLHHSSEGEMSLSSGEELLKHANVLLLSVLEHTLY